MEVPLLYGMYCNRSAPHMLQYAVISDLGSGGQILMDEPTFQKVKNVLFELGTVDHHGIDFSQLQAVPEALLCFKG